MLSHRAGKAASDLRRHNQALVLDLVRTQGPVSRAQIARLGRLSMPAVMDIAGALIEEGLVREVGVGPSSGGRRPMLLDVVPEAFCALGVEVGTRTIRAVVTDLHAVVRHWTEVSSEMERGPAALQCQLSVLLRDMLHDATRGFGGVLGVGLAVPAPILDSTALSFSPPSFPHWGELQLGDWLSTELKLPVLVENDAKAAALGEFLYGAGRGVRNLFYLIVHRGVGGAAIINGELYRGADGGAGEIGHVAIERDGPLCGCGQHGCLEALVGREAIRQRAIQALRQSGAAELAGCPVDALGTDDIFDAALAGDPLARNILIETGQFLGQGLATVVNLFNPELVILGGATMRAGPLILDPIAEVVQRRSMAGLAQHVRIVPGALGQDAGAIGAAALVLRQLFAPAVELK
ncbi:MAG: ROK family protein [Chloroflexi bacterium]|nr:ROK family protein [Chloroflexota bacterium]